MKRTLLRALLFAAFLWTGDSLAATEPAILAEKAVLWLDASKPETIFTNETGGVTNWISRSKTVTAARQNTTASVGNLAPVYEPTKYGQACVDFGAAGSGMDLTFPELSFQTAVFCVKIEQKCDAFLIGSATSYLAHRGVNGEWKYTGFTIVQDAWQDAVKVMTPLTTTKMPDDDFYVFAVRLSGPGKTALLTQDHTVSSRNGGRQLSEAIFFSQSLEDDQVNLVSQYLLRKWKSSPNVSVSGTPSQRGTVTPGYGVYTDLTKGTKYTFRAPAALTNDSRTLYCDLNGWTLIKTDFTTESGKENEMSFTYDDETSYATVTWNWSDYARLPPDRGAWLPQKYRCVEYIEQAGSAYIDTDIKLTTKTTDIVFTIGAKDSTVDSSNDQKWLGIHDNPGFWIGRFNGKWYASRNGNSAYSSAYKDSLGPLTVVISDGKWTFFDPESPTAYMTESFGDCAHPAKDGTSILRLFFIGNATDIPSQYAAVGTRIYQLEIYEGATCAHKLVAARHAGDGKIGFYDTVTDKFYTNPSGNFLAGPRDRRYIRGFAIVIQ